MRRCPASLNPTEPLIAVAGQEVELQVWNLKDLQAKQHVATVMKIKEREGAINELFISLVLKVL